MIRGQGHDDVNKTYKVWKLLDIVQTLMNAGLSSCKWQYKLQESQTMKIDDEIGRLAIETTSG